MKKLIKKWDTVTLEKEVSKELMNYEALSMEVSCGSDLYDKEEMFGLKFVLAKSETTLNTLTEELSRRLGTGAVKTLLAVSDDRDSFHKFTE